MNALAGLAVRRDFGWLTFRTTGLTSYTYREPAELWQKGEKKGQFKEPSGVAVDKDNNLYVADAWNGRIQKFDSKGRFVLEVGGEKAGFYSPRNVAVNDYGMVHVADTGTSRIHRFDTDGNRIGKPFGERGKALGNFQEVFGLAFDRKKRVYVAIREHARGCFIRDLNGSFH